MSQRRNRPTTRMWWAEVLVFAVVTAVVALVLAVLIGSALRRSPIIDLGGIIPAAIVGLWAAARFRHHVLNHPGNSAD